MLSRRHSAPRDSFALAHSHADNRTTTPNPDSELSCLPTGSQHPPCTATPPGKGRSHQWKPLGDEDTGQCPGRLQLPPRCPPAARGSPVLPGRDVGEVHVGRDDHSYATCATLQETGELRVPGIPGRRRGPEWQSRLRLDLCHSTFQSCPRGASAAPMACSAPR